MGWLQSSFNLFVTGPHRVSAFQSLRRILMTAISSSRERLRDKNLRRSNRSWANRVLPHRRRDTLQHHSSQFPLHISARIAWTAFKLAREFSLHAAVFTSPLPLWKSSTYPGEPHSGLQTNTLPHQFYLSSHRLSSTKFGHLSPKNLLLSSEGFHPWH
jgi:hypothetical protein